MPGGLLAIPGDGSIVEVQGTAGGLDTGGNWWRLPGVAGWSEGGGDTPTRDIVAFEGVSSQSGRVRAQTIECEVTAYAPLHRAWRLVRAALIAKSALTFRLRTVRSQFYPQTSGGPKLAIAANTGEVTPSNGAGPANAAALLTTRLAGSEFAPGMVLEIGSSAGAPAMLTIEDISDAGAMVVSDPAKPAKVAMITATDKWRITLPETLRGPFSATVSEADRITTRAEGDFAAGLTLAATGVLPEVTATAGPNLT